MSLTTGVCEWCGKQAAADCCHRREIENLKADVAVFKRDRDWAHARVQKLEADVQGWRDSEAKAFARAREAEARLVEIEKAFAIFKEMLK